MPIQTKICGLSTPETLDAAIAGGASHVGFMFFPPSPRAISFEQVAALAARAPTQVKRVGVFVEPCNALLEQAMAAAALDVVQLHNCPPNRCAAIAAHTGLDVWAAVAIKTRADLATVPAYRGAATGILYDSSGGTGLRLDWNLLQGFNHPLPWGLAGGLSPDNVAEAIRATGAPLVDVSSGVESAPGIKDVDKITAFLKAARDL